MLLSGPAIPRPDPQYTLENIVAGKFDPAFRSRMQDAQRFGSPLIAEYGVEVNGFWFPWNGLHNRGQGSYADAVARFREACRHIIAIAREEGARNIRWVFHVDPWDEPAEPWNRVENYFPGDAWIDWVGVSVYGRQLPSDRQIHSFRARWIGHIGGSERLPANRWSFANSEPFASKARRPWAEAALEDLFGGRWPSVIGFSWWNSEFANDPRTHRRSNMRVQDSPALRDGLAAAEKLGSALMPYPRGSHFRAAVCCVHHIGTGRTRRSQ